MPIYRQVSNLPCRNSYIDGSRGYVNVYHSLRTNHSPFPDNYSRKEECVRTNACAFLHRGADQLVWFLRNKFVVREDAAWAEEDSVFDF